jgi:hypothetical protein
MRNCVSCMFYFDKVSVGVGNERLDAIWRLLVQDYLMGSPVTSLCKIFAGRDTTDTNA